MRRRLIQACIFFSCIKLTASLHPEYITCSVDNEHSRTILNIAEKESFKFQTFDELLLENSRLKVVQIVTESNNECRYSYYEAENFFDWQTQLHPNKQLCLVDPIELLDISKRTQIISWAVYAASPSGFFEKTFEHCHRVDHKRQTQDLVSKDFGFIVLACGLVFLAGNLWRDCQNFSQ